MLGLFSRPSSRRAAVRVTKLRLQSLETRDCPAAPVVVSLEIVPVDASHMRIVGTVVDETAANCVVQLSGLANANFTPGANGQFNVLVPLASTGTVTALATDVSGEVSDPVECSPQVNAKPVIIDFGASCEGGNVWEISGKVVDEHPSGLSVQIRSAVPGLGNITLTTDADGNFEHLFTVPWDFKGGDASADVTDDMGLAADTVYTYIA